MSVTPPSISTEQLTQWADSLLSINHLNTLVQREIAANSLPRAAELAERARKRAWKMLNEMFAAGAIKPEGYCEPDPFLGACDAQRLRLDRDREASHDLNRLLDKPGL